MPWNPDIYAKFKTQRYLPFQDLMAMVNVRSGLRVIDLGCGNGDLTRRLADKLPGSDVLGIDSSAEMLVAAAQHSRPGLRFEQRTIEEIDGEFDLIFSHAAIQWVPDHRELLPKLLAKLTAGGQLTVQIPANFKHPTHTLIEAVADEEPFHTAFNGYQKEFYVLGIDDYAEILNQAGGQQLTVMSKIYPHYLESSDQLAEWMSGTALIPYVERLPREHHDAFMDRYRDRLRQVFPGSPVFFGF
ncbi:MAG: methyltransferase domain-containing protein, partial [Pyrinomonadaceae bacterium]